MIYKLCFDIIGNWDQVRSGGFVYIDEKFKKFWEHLNKDYILNNKQDLIAKKLFNITATAYHIEPLKALSKVYTVNDIKKLYEDGKL